jgi:hypothetical protein
MTRWGEVSYRVKRAVAFYERFTIAQLTDSTGLTYEQVEQVIHRLVNRGDVHRLLPEELTEAEQQVEKRAGRPCARYTLTEDPIRRAEFLADLEAIAAAARLELAPARRPDTPYYAAALRIIEAMEAGEERVRLAHLREAEELLVYGREYESLVTEGLEVVQTFYDLALARLKTLGGESLSAERLLEQAGQTLAQVGLDEEACRIAERRLALKVERELGAVEQALDDGRDTLAILERLRGSLLDAPWTPLLPPLCRAIDLLIRLITLGPGARTAISEFLIELRAEAWSRHQHRQQQAKMLTQMERAVEQLAPELPSPQRDRGGRDLWISHEPEAPFPPRPRLVD